jgi:translation elongation factor EF-1beta
MSPHVAVVVPSGQGLKQIGELALAFGLSSLIGLELEVQGQPFVEPLTTALESVSGVLEVSSRDLARATD